ncbi:uncharacterized protein C1orf94 homolog [Ascaphus truei]|uniref:uncharacterized protein C1orf94 homolog n=1 Tax=Ascaphus truei TaxID=8439 RepID=UPI003F59B1C2
MLTSVTIPLQCQTTPKHVPPLGPFPRYIWVHQDTPQDSLDKTCYEIWKRVQSLPEEMKPRKVKESPPAERAENGGVIGIIEGYSEWSSAKDEISRLVQQEYLNLTIENIINAELQGLQCDLGEKTHTEAAQTTPIQHLEDQVPKAPVENLIKSLMSSKDNEVKTLPQQNPTPGNCFTQDTFSLMKAAPKSTLAKQESYSSIVASNKEIRNLLAQFPVKSTETSKLPNNKTVMEETRAIKNFLKNNMFSPESSHKNDGCLSTATDKAPESQLPVVKKQLPVFAKICSKTGLEVTDAPIFSAAPATATDKINLRYTGHVFIPRTPTTAATAIINRPYLLNFPPPPPALLPNHSSFAQYQNLYQPRTPFPQTLHPQLGCFSRQVHPYNPQQVSQPVFCTPYSPLLHYIPFVQPDYLYQQRNSSKPTTNTRDPPPMAGDGPQFLFPHLYRFNPPITRPVINGPYFTSSGNGMKPF